MWLPDLFRFRYTTDVIIKVNLVISRTMILVLDNKIGLDFGYARIVLVKK